MRTTVIDANVFHAYFYETLHGKPHLERTGSAMPLFQALGSACIGFLDDGSLIESEWRNVSKGAEEWFNTWLAESLAEGKLFEIAPSTDKGLSKRYAAAGFPRGRDICYIRVAHALTNLCRRSKPCLVAEDIDFYDPKKKAHPGKADTLRRGVGPVSSLLNNDGIELRCIETFCAELKAE